MKKFILLLSLAAFTLSSVFAQYHRYEGSVEYKKRRGTGKIVLSPGANTDIVLNDSTTIRYTNGTIRFLINGTERLKSSATSLTVPGITIGSTALTATGTEINYTDGVTSAIQTQLNAKADTVKSFGQLFRADTTGKAMDSASWYTLILSDGLAENTTVTDTSVLIIRSGYYEVSATGNVLAKHDTTNVFFGVYVGSTIQPQVTATTELKAKDKYETIALNGVVKLTAGNLVRLRWSADRSTWVRHKSVNFNIKRL